MLVAVKVCSLYLSISLVSGLLPEGPERYIGAVVEYGAPNYEDFHSAQELLLYNVNRYVKIIEEAAKENADIIVFPECGLTTIDFPIIRDTIKQFTTFLPEPNDGIIPCDDKEANIAEHVRLLSCAAKKYKIYTVVNLQEKSSCSSVETGCPSDHLLFYNTNIVFDRDGKIIAKYRKINLFGELEFNITALPQYSIFETDFGVTFGTFICFDILFREPSIDILKYNITDIVYSTAWLSELPMLTAVQTQAGYSYTMNVNLLAAGYDNPTGSGSGGSGIYAGETGPIVMTMPAQKITTLLIGEVPIKREGSERQAYSVSANSQSVNCELTDSCSVLKAKTININFENTLELTKPKEISSGMHFLKQDMTMFSSKLLQEIDNSLDENSVNKLVDVDNEQETSFTYINEGFDCSIKVKWAKFRNLNQGPFYRLVGYSGTRSYAKVRTEPIAVCSIVACPNESLSSCGEQPTFDEQSRTNILSVSILTKSEMKLEPFPMTLDENILPLLGDELSMVKSIDTSSSKQNLNEAELFLEKPRDNIITFGVHYF